MINLFILLISNLPGRQMISVNFGPIYQQYFIHLTLSFFSVFLSHCVICLHSMTIKYNVGSRFKEKLLGKSTAMKKYSNGGKAKLYAIFLSCEHLDQIGKTIHKISVQSNPTCKMLIEIKMFL